MYVSQRAKIESGENRNGRTMLLRANLVHAKIGLYISSKRFELLTPIMFQEWQGINNAIFCLHVGMIQTMRLTQSN